MIPSYTYSALLDYDKCAYTQLLKERHEELLQFQLAISAELESLTLELQVLDWRKNSGKTITKKITLYEDFFKKVRKAPRQDKHIDLDVMAEARRALEEL
jgi:hypothetical protein